MDGRLARRVGAAHDVDALPRELTCLRGRGSVVDTAALEGAECGYLKPSIRHPDREDHAAGFDARTARDRHGVGRLAELDVRDLSRQQEGRPEHPRLLVRTLRELGAREAAREAEVVADPRARSRLPAY